MVAVDWVVLVATGTVVTVALVVGEAAPPVVDRGAMEALTRRPAPKPLHQLAPVATENEKLPKLIRRHPNECIS